MTISPLPLETENRLRAEMNRDEQLLWTGQPLASRAWYGSIPIVLFGIFWTACCIRWIAVASSIARQAPADSASVSLTSVLFPLFGVPFVLVGVWMLSKPYWAIRKAQRTVYALTDKRALLLIPTWRNAITVRSISPEDLTSRTRTHRSDGSGTIVFDRLTTTRRYGDDGTYYVKVGFENIPDVRDVDALIERTYPASV